MKYFNRRDFLKASSVTLAGLSIASGGCMAAKTKSLTTARHPNVLFIISDDLCVCMSGYKHPQCKTPNLDRLGKRGVSFDNAYCQYPVCGPSRASIMTGQYPEAIDTLSNKNSRFRKNNPDMVSLPQFFMKQGYYSARISKIYHMGIPTEIIDGTSRSDDPKSWNEAINIKAPEHNAAGLKEDLSPKVTSSGRDFVKVEADGDDLVHADGMAAEKAIELLGQLKDKKFFLAVGMVRPHVPLVAPKSYFKPYDPQDMKLAEEHEDDLKDVPRAAQTQTNAVKYGMNTEQQKKTLSAYYASVSYMDAQVGKILDELERLGLDENTVVVFTSDHGYNLGQHTSWQKLSLWEDSVRSPLIISAPGKANARAKRSGKIVELIDIYPTLVDLCGFEVPGNLAGTSLRPLLRDPENKEWKDKSAYTITHKGGRSLRTKKWRFNSWDNGKDGFELYDHENDPGEFKNLADKKEYRNIVNKFKRQLKNKKLKIQKQQLP